MATDNETADPYEQTVAPRPMPLTALHGWWNASRRASLVSPGTDVSDLPLLWRNGRTSDSVCDDEVPSLPTWALCGRFVDPLIEEAFVLFAYAGSSPMYPALLAAVAGGSGLTVNGGIMSEYPPFLSRPDVAAAQIAVVAISIALLAAAVTMLLCRATRRYCDPASVERQYVVVLWLWCIFAAANRPFRLCNVYCRRQSDWHNGFDVYSWTPLVVLTVAAVRFIHAVPPVAASVVLQCVVMSGYDRAPHIDDLLGALVLGGALFLVKVNEAANRSGFAKHRHATSLSEQTTKARSVVDRLVGSRLPASLMDSLARGDRCYCTREAATVVAILIGPTFRDAVDQHGAAAQYDDEQNEEIDMRMFLDGRSVDGAFEPPLTGAAGIAIPEQRDERDHGSPAAMAVFKPSDVVHPPSQDAAQSEAAMAAVVEFIETELAELGGLRVVSTLGAPHVLVAFGAPHSLPLHEVRAATLASRVAVAAGRGAFGATTSVRIGVHRGPVHGGVFSDQRLAFQCYGATVDWAFEVARTAQPGTALMSLLTYIHIGGHARVATELARPLIAFGSETPLLRVLACEWNPVLLNQSPSRGESAEPLIRYRSLSAASASTKLRVARRRRSVVRYVVKDELLHPAAPVLNPLAVVPMTASVASVAIHETVESQWIQRIVADVLKDRDAALSGSLQADSGDVDLDVLRARLENEPATITHVFTTARLEDCFRVDCATQFGASLGPSTWLALVPFYVGLVIALAVEGSPSRTSYALLAVVIAVSTAVFACKPFSRGVFGRHPRAAAVCDTVGIGACHVAAMLSITASYGYSAMATNDYELPVLALFLLLCAPRGVFGFSWLPTFVATTLIIELPFLAVYFVYQRPMNPAGWMIVVFYPLILVVAYWRSDVAARRQFTEVFVGRVALREAAEERRNLEAVLSRTVPQFLMADTLVWMPKRHASLFAAPEPNATADRTPSVTRQFGALPMLVMRLRGVDSRAQPHAENAAGDDAPPPLALEAMLACVAATLDAEHADRLYWSQSSTSATSFVETRRPPEFNRRAVLLHSTSQWLVLGSCDDSARSDDAGGLGELLPRRDPNECSGRLAHLLRIGERIATAVKTWNESPAAAQHGVRGQVAAVLTLGPACVVVQPVDLETTVLSAELDAAKDFLMDVTEGGVWLDPAAAPYLPNKQFVDFDSPAPVPSLDQIAIVGITSTMSTSGSSFDATSTVSSAMLGDHTSALPGKGTETQLRAQVRCYLRQFVSKRSGVLMSGTLVELHYESLGKQQLR